MIVVLMTDDHAFITEIDMLVQSNSHTLPLDILYYIILYYNSVNCTALVLCGTCLVE